jgi:hypothetical protein
LVGEETRDITAGHSLDPCCLGFGGRALYLLATGGARQSCPVRGLVTEPFRVRSPRQCCNAGFSPRPQPFRTYPGLVCCCGFKRSELRKHSVLSSLQRSPSVSSGAESGQPRAWRCPQALNGPSRGVGWSTAADPFGLPLGPGTLLTLPEAQAILGTPAMSHYDRGVPHSNAPDGPRGAGASTHGFRRDVANLDRPPHPPFGQTVEGKSRKSTVCSRCFFKSQGKPWKGAEAAKAATCSATDLSSGRKVSRSALRVVRVE